MRNLVLVPDPPDSGGAPTEQKPAPAPDPVPAIPPPAATGVVNGRTENEANLERELEEERNKRKKVETDNAHLEDEVRTLKQQQSTEPAQGKRSSGWVFPDEE